MYSSAFKPDGMGDHGNSSWICRSEWPCILSKRCCIVSVKCRIQLKLFTLGIYRGYWYCNGRHGSPRSVRVLFFSLSIADNSSANIRHQVLQLALTYICGVSQLSTGAYFLRRDFFPPIISVRRRQLVLSTRSWVLSSITLKLVKSPEMEQYTFEAILFLAILANYHKLDAAKLNPYLKRIRETMDTDVLILKLSHTVEQQRPSSMKPLTESLKSTLLVLMAWNRRRLDAKLFLKMSSSAILRDLLFKLSKSWTSLSAPVRLLH